jgi:hypothetical protein
LRHAHSCTVHFSLLLNEKAVLLPVALKKRIKPKCRITRISTRKNPSIKRVKNHGRQPTILDNMWRVYTTLEISPIQLSCIGLSLSALALSPLEVRLYIYLIHSITGPLECLHLYLGAQWTVEIAFGQLEWRCRENVELLLSSMHFALAYVS